MPRTIRLPGREHYFRLRDPLMVWVLQLATAGIYAYFWLYQVNADAREFLQDERIDPSRRVLQLCVPLFILIGTIALAAIGASASGQDAAAAVGEIGSVATVLSVIAPVVALVRTGRAVQAMEVSVGIPWDRQTDAWLFVLLSFVFGSGIAYLQSHVNRALLAAATAASASTTTGAALTRTGDEPRTLIDVDS